MNFLRALFWIVLTIVVVVFSMRNWTVVTVNLFGGLAADVKLPVLLLVAFLIGFGPLYIWHRARVWRLQRRLLAAERSLLPVASPIVDEPLAAAPATAYPMSSRIFVAIDTPDLARAQAIAARVRAHAGGIKLGLEFFAAHGSAGVREMAGAGLPIFLDLKLHDIPNTVASAIQALGQLHPAILTVHAGGGRAMMEDAKAAAPAETKVVAVTVLTSLDDGDLARAGIGDGAHAQVERLTDLAREAGIDGVVCSGHEVEAAHRRWRDGFLVVPGVRPAGAALGDQKRAVTPREAVDRGASIIVVGRPITRADDPDAALRAIAGTL